MNTMIDKRNNKAVALIFTVLLSIIILIIAAACFIAFSNFISFTRFHEANSQSDYLAECGIYRGKWLLDGSHIPLPPADNPYTGSITIDSNIINITITYLSADGYTISSTDSATGRSITVNYINSQIDSWN